MNTLKQIQIKFSSHLFLLTLMVCLFPKFSSAQLNEYGLNVSFLANRYTISNNFPAEDVIISQGRVFPGFSFGGQLLIGPPRDQMLQKLTLKHGFLVETNFSRGGGKVNYVYRTPRGLRSFNELTYVTWSSHLNLLYKAGLGKVQFLLGPTFTYNFFRGLKFPGSESYRSADDQISQIVLGGEIGVGIRLENFTLSTRYNMAVSPFGKPTSLLPVKYNLHQARFVISWFIFEKHTGKNSHSIIGL